MRVGTALSLQKAGPPPRLDSLGAGLRARPAWTRALPGPSDVHTFSCHHTQQPGRVPFWHHHSGGQLFDGQLP